MSRRYRPARIVWTRRLRNCAVPHCRAISDLSYFALSRVRRKKCTRLGPVIRDSGEHRQAAGAVGQ